MREVSDVARSVLLCAIALVGAGYVKPPPADDEERQGTSRQAQQYLADYADCIVAKRSYRTKVATFLREMPGSATPHSAPIVEPQCLTDAAVAAHARITLRIPPELFRLALYSALYKRDYGKAGPVAAISDAPPARLSTEFDGPVDALPATYRPVRLLGDCVVRASPVATHALLIAAPNTPAEDAALAQLRPALESCLIQDQTVRMNRASLRGAVAESAYKLALAVQPPQR